MKFRALIPATALLLTLPAFAASPKPVKVMLKNGTGGDAGSVTFSPDKKGVKVKIELKDLPVGDHGVHVHANPTCDGPDFTTAGGHFNPESKKHGFLSPAGHHAGDFEGSVMVGENHRGEATFHATYLSLGAGDANSILNHAVVVHEKKDDQTTDPSGASGNRIACGVIPGPGM